MNRLILGTSAVAEPFWEATKQQKFMLQFCTGTGKAIWYPRNFSPYDLNAGVEWREVEANGTVYAVSVMHRPGNPAMVRLISQLTGRRFIFGGKVRDVMIAIPG